MSPARLLRLAAACLAALPLWAGAAEWLVAEVSLNGEPRGTALLLEDGDRLWVELDEARAWRLAVPEASVVEKDGRRFVALADLRLNVRSFDRRSLRLELDAPAGAFLPSAQTLGGREYRLTPATWGGYASYDLVATRAGGRSTVDGAFQLAGFSPQGALDAQFIKRELWASDAARSPWVRQSTTYRRDWAESLSSLEVGDTFTRATAATRPVRIGGVWAGTNFGLRPGFISQPLPSFAGEAALPSTVQVFVNNQLRSVTDVPAGPFRLDSVPVVNGAGDARMVVRDALGRETVVNSSFYATSALLAPGLNQYGVALGRLRTDAADGRADYGHLYGSASLRQGLAAGLTLEFAGEFEASRAVMFGTAASFALPVGEGELSGGWSAPGGAGPVRGRMAAGYSFQTPMGGVQLRYQRAASGLVSPGETDPGQGVRRAFTASGSWRLAEALSAGAALIDTQTQDGRRLRTQNLSLSRALPRGVQLALALNRVSDGDTRRQGVALLVSLPLGRDVYASAAVEGGSDRRQTATVQQTPPLGEGYGWRVAAGHDAQGARAEAGLLAQLPAATLQAEVARVPGQDTALRAQAAGSLALVGGQWTATRQVFDAFALVDIPGVHEVPVLLNNQPIGQTNAEGRLLVPRLMAYVPSEIKLDVTGLPPDAEIEPGRERVVVVPGARSAVRAELGVRRVAAAVVSVVDAGGKPLPAGATVQVAGEGLVTSVAGKGEFYVSGAPGPRRATLVSRGVACTVDFNLPLAPAGQAYSQLGPYPCVASPR